MSPHYIELHCQSSFSFRPKMYWRSEAEGRRESVPLTTFSLACRLSLAAGTHSLAREVHVGHRLAS